jgi:hypothetical protein
MKTVVYLTMYIFLVVFGVAFLNHHMEDEDIIGEWEDEEL